MVAIGQSRKASPSTPSPLSMNQVELADYFRENVIGGSAAFILAAADYEDNAHAIRLKLLYKIRPEALSSHDAGRRTMTAAVTRRF